MWCYYLFKIKIYVVILRFFVRSEVFIENVVLCYTDISIWDFNSFSFYMLGGIFGISVYCYCSEENGFFFVIM